MATNKAIEKIEEAESSAMNSGQTSPSYNPTIFSGHKRSNSAETVDSEVTEIGSPSVSVNNMPGPPVNTPATTSIAGETPISSPCDAGSIAAILHGMPSKLISPPASVTTEHKGMTKPKGAAGNMRKSVLKKRLTSKSAGEPGDTTTFENSVWEDFAEEDAKNALKRLAMLAKDEHKRSHEAQPLSNYYSARLAKIVQEAEIEFDPVFLQKFARAAEVAKQSELVDKDVIME